MLSGRKHSARLLVIFLLLQVGLPSDSNQYVHRLGRTARAGKSGSGLLVLTEAEQGFIREVSLGFIPLVSVRALAVAVLVFGVVVVAGVVRAYSCVLLLLSLLLVARLLC